MKTLKAGIIGLGVGEKHIQAYESHPDCEVIALCDFAEEKFFKAAQKYPGINITRDAGEILSDPKINVVSIASFDNYHFEQVMKAIQNDKHVFVEKPLCLHQSEAIQIRSLLRKNSHIKISSNLNLRTCPRFKWLKNAIHAGHMGQIYYIEADYLWGRLQKLCNGWRKEMDFYSIVHGAAVHMIDLVLWLTGMTPVEVQGYGSKISTLGSDFKYNDFATILIKFNNGMIAKVSANGGCVHPHFHKLTLYGTRKTFIHDIGGAKLLNCRNPQSEIKDINEEYPGQEKGDIIYSFIQSILHSNAEAIVTDYDVFTTMSVCFAAEKAIKEGQPTTIQYI